MRKLIFQVMVSLDGFFEGPDHDIEWHMVDDEFNAFVHHSMRSVDTLLFGRVTYELMASYWPSRQALTDDPITARLMNDASKLVFSRTLHKAEWQHTRLVKENAVQEIQRLKAGPGKDMAVFGSSDLCLTLIQHGLIDEFRIAICPVVLGRGKSLFHGLKKHLQLQLFKTETFGSGVVMHYYVAKLEAA